MVYQSNYRLYCFMFKGYTFYAGKELSIQLAHINIDQCFGCGILSAW